MKLSPIASNMTEVEIDVGGIRYTVLFSYATPVAAYASLVPHQIPAPDSLESGGFYRTSKFWSVTTTKHINKWLQSASDREMDQAWFDSLVEKA